jgi:predicted dienelactone hydrolase
MLFSSLFMFALLVITAVRPTTTTQGSAHSSPQESRQPGTVAPIAPRQAGDQTLVPDDWVFGDALPDAPELAVRGSFGVGVRTLQVVNPDQLDILKYSEANPNPRYDRPLTLEVWYPGVIPAGIEQRTTYTDVLGSGPGNPQRPNTPFPITGRALRDAAPDASQGPYPLVIVSHGYPGSRYLMAYLCENLASKGYVVVAIDHTESTHGDKAGFASTLLNRSFDQLFTLDQMAQFSATPDSFLSNMVDAERTAIVGYSMGGYGALNTAGAGVNPSSPIYNLVPGNKLAVRAAGNPEYQASLDPRVKAIVAFAPWGRQHNLWNAEGLAGLRVPSLFVVGNRDDVSQYETGVKRIYEDAVNSDRYMLVYQNALHNVAPHPPPAITLEPNANFDDYMHYAEPVWSMPRLNNINQHFVTAFLGLHLKDEANRSYLDLVTQSNDGKWSQNPDGSFKPDHTYWKGFKNRTALGMEMYHAAPPAKDRFSYVPMTTR